MMTITSGTLRYLVPAILGLLYCASLYAEEETDTIPGVLKSLVRSKRHHAEAPAIRIFTKDGLPAISLSTSAPLTEAQWDAVAALHPKWFSFNDQSLTDRDMDRLVALDPVAVTLRITPLTGTGAAKFGQMKHLTKLVTHHLINSTPEARDALANHPTLEVFRTAGDFCIDALRAPQLKDVELAQNAATPARVEELAAHSQIESLSLFAHNVVTVDDACLASVAKIKTLQKLKLSHTVLSFEGGLKQLLALPQLKQLSLYMVDVSDADLRRFKVALPEVQVKHTPMMPEYRKKWDEMIAAASKNKSMIAKINIRFSLAPLLGTLLLLCVTPSDAAPTDKPNVIMILMDDLGWRDLHCTGSTFYETPNIDALAARGVMFTRTYAAASICSPTRASILTGLYPGRIGLTLPAGADDNEVLDARVQLRAYSLAEAKSKQTEEKPVRGGPQVQKALQVVSATRLSTTYPTIAKLFEANGYRTAHFGKWHLGPEPYSALEHGFDVDVPHINSAGPPRPGHFGPWPDWTGENGQENKGRQVDECLAEHAIQFIHENKDRPFYLNFWSYGVHIPFQAKPELIKYFEAKADPNAGQRNPLYAAMIKHTDDAIGRVWAAVEGAGLADKTVIVFMSDNGGVTAGGGKPPGPKDKRITDNAPLRGEKGDVYEGGVRVPGFIVWPGVGKPGAKSDVTFTSTDVLPTLAEICELHDLPKVDGQSVAPAVAGKPMTSRPFFMHYPHYGNWDNGGHPATSVVADGWKLIRFYFDGPDQQHRYELYHLDEDLGESVNLAEQQPERMQALDRMIDGFLADTKAVQPKCNPDYQPPPSPKSNVISSPKLRVEVSEKDGALTIIDLRNKLVWQQVRVETEDSLKQKIVSFDPARNELLLECGMSGTRTDGKRAVAPARITLRIPRIKSDIEMIIHLDSREQWRQAAYPYVFVRDGERVDNLFPHCEGLLVPVRKNDPDWLTLPDGDLYGGVHSYLMCLGLVDEATGEGLLTLMPDIESTILKWRDVPVDEQTVVAPQLVCRANKGRFDRPWRFTFSFSDQGGYVALAERYREFFAAQGLHKTLREKAVENPAVNEISGGTVFWANTRTPKQAADMADSFRAAGVDRCLFAMCNVPLHKPEVPDYERQTADAIKHVRSLGYHVYRYDQYRDAFEPDSTKGHSDQLNTNAWPDKLVHRADGSRVAAFGPQSGIVCAKYFMPLAMETFDREFAQFDYSARFLDCLGSVSFGQEAECFDPAHPCDRYFTRQQRTSLLVELNRRGKLAATECGIDYLIPHVHWFEGASTLVRWKEFFPAKQTTENTGINDDTGGKSSDRVAALAKLDPIAKADLTVSIGPRHRIPFYSLCHHDEVIVTWRWEDGMDDPPVYWQLKNLWSVLSGTPPMYRTTADRIAKYREQITRTQHYVNDWVKMIAFDAMTSHRFLTADRTVQETEFSSGRGVVVNFGETSFTLPDQHTVKARDYIAFEVTSAGRKYLPPPPPNVFAD